jgi:hypothetical protein
MSQTRMRNRARSYRFCGQRMFIAPVVESRDRSVIPADYTEQSADCS